MLFWDDIQGHTRVKEVLGRSMLNGRLHHALLLAGPQGVGKLALAKAISATLYCTGRSKAAPFAPACGQCPSCRKMEQGIHPDLQIIEPEGKKLKRIKIDQIRQMQKKTATSPYEADEHIIILDDAHTMTEEAANALLKTLEEPGHHMRLLLVSQSTHLLLDTILSRCQLIRFGALPYESVTRILDRLVRQSETIEGPLGEELLRIAAGYGEGSPGVAFHVIESGLLYEREDLMRQILALDNTHPLTVLDLAEQLAKKNPMLEEHFDILQVFMRDLMLYKVHPSDARIINTDLMRYIQQLDEVMSLDDTMQTIDQVRQARLRYQHNVNAQLILEDLFERISVHTSVSKARRPIQRPS